MTDEISCTIVDDDTSAISILEKHLAHIPRLKLHRTFTRPVEALNAIDTYQDNHLIFMDIDMPGMSGMKLAENLRHTSHNIIFITSYQEYALAAIKVRAKHYLLKPFGLDDLAEVVNIVIRECYELKNFDSEDENAFFFRTDKELGKLKRVEKAEIVYVQGANHHIHIYTPTENFSVYMSLGELEEGLRKNRQFFRVHKSYILNVGYIKNIDGNKINLGKYEVLMTSSFKKDFVSYVERNTLKTNRNT
ncbi:LytR/AlgR family response regulator transcription factor [Pedobacter sp. R-06]|uniref:LytR/AlgR family response regulator transcription factor n=1 Tax=Pedobacter sp. R-06 TaxID=3404051 RepID=UPI003CEC2877